MLEQWILFFYYFFSTKNWLNTHLRVRLCTGGEDNVPSAAEARRAVVERGDGAEEAERSQVPHLGTSMFPLLKLVIKLIILLC